MLDASRPSAAAAAATELAALRRLRQLQQLHEQHQNRNTIDTHLLQQENLRQQQQQQQEQQHQQYGRREGAEAAHVGHAAGQVSAGWPFVQLLDSFTWRHGGAAQGSGSRSGSGSMGTAGGSGCVVSGGGGGGGGGVSGGGGGGGGDAARCLVLQRLGPCATDVLSMWRQEQNGVQKEGQEECGRGSAGGRGATGAGRREAAAGGGACGGLPPCAVKRFARQALLALDLMHRWGCGCVLLLTGVQHSALHIRTCVWWCLSRATRTVRAADSQQQCACVMPHAPGAWATPAPCNHRRNSYR